MRTHQVIFRGLVKYTKGQIKKHYTQMNQTEKAYLVYEIKKVRSNFKYSAHYLESPRKFNALSIYRLLNAFTLKQCIIEYNEKTNMKTGEVSKRVLLRSQDVYDVVLEKNENVVKTKANLCVVLELDTGVIITAYWNEVNDSHLTINMNRYSENLCILP